MNLLPLHTRALDGQPCRHGNNRLGNYCDVHCAVMEPSSKPTSVRPRTPLSYSLVPYQSHHRRAFANLNLQWLRQYFVVEPIDEKVLNDPEQYILEPGGAIVCAVSNEGQVIGVCALIAKGAGRFEMSKMAVDPNVHGLGIGRALANSIIELFKKRGGVVLYLESNTVLEPAIALYRSIGFVEKPKPSESPYERSNIYMEYIEGDSNGYARDPLMYVF